MTDVTDEITALLMKAMRLSIAAGGNCAGSHALIARAALDADGTIILDWERYGPEVIAPAGGNAS